MTLRRDLRALLPYLIAATLASLLVLLLLAELHERIAHPRVEALDHNLQAWVHAHSSPSLQRLMEALTLIGEPRTDVPLCALAAWALWRRHRREALLLVCSMAGAGLLDLALKLHYKRIRPDVPWRWGHEHSYSFPSGHSMAAVVMYGTLLYIVLGLLRSHWQRALACLLAFTLALAIGYSRIYLGAHWPTDVIAGYLAGTLWLTGLIAADAHTCRRWPWQRPEASTA